MSQIDLRRVDLNLLVVFEVLMAERSVTRAAERLGRTQSAISHSLARLREQVGDPLLVKVGGRMSPSPFAERLADEVRPILRSIQRVLVPPVAFDPATSTRVFRVALPDLTPSLFPLLAERVRREAPSAAIEWVARDEAMWPALVEGQVDVALVPSASALPEGLDRMEVGSFKWACFARRGHPAARAWGRKAWSQWPHLVVRVGVRVANPVETAEGPGPKRRIGAWVPNFAAVAPLLARTDLVATLPILVMYETLLPYGLRALRLPVPLEPMPHRLAWSVRHGNDPAVRWLRGHLQAVMAEVLAAADARLPG